MHKLLIPVDNSENSLRALQYAIGLAREYGSIELVIVNAHEQPLVFGEIAVYLPEAKAMALQRQHSEDILKPAIELAQKSGAKYTSEVLIGNVPEVIVKFAEESGCDGIVMGTRGMGTVGNLLLGSIATKVVHLAKMPVTLIK